MTNITIILSVPDAKATEVLNYVTDYLGYQTQIEQSEGVFIANPQTRKQYLDVQVKSFVKNCYISQKAKLADSYRVTAISDAEAVNITV